MTPQLHVGDRWLDQAIRLIVLRPRVRPPILVDLTEVAAVGPARPAPPQRTPVRAVRSALDVPVG